MCLTTEAFALFLTMIGAAVVSPEGSAVTVHATDGDVYWEAVGDKWCTDAPKTHAQKSTLNQKS